MSATDTLEQMTNTQLNELFAVTHGGWTEVPLTRAMKAKGFAALFRHAVVHTPGAQPYTPECIRWKDGRYGGETLPDYCASTDAILPWLEKWAVTIERIPEWPAPWQVQVENDDHCYMGRAATLPRAAVIALLRAKRAETT